MTGDGDPNFVDALLESLKQALNKILLYQEGMNDTGKKILRAMVAERLADLSDLGAVQRGLQLVDDARAKGANV